MKRFKFNRFALSEMIDAAKYYEKEKPGLGKIFLNQVKQSLTHIQSFPQSGVILEDEIRRHSLRRFRYSIVYSIEPDAIYITSIMHQSRNPEHWKGNLKD